MPPTIARAAGLPLRAMRAFRKSGGTGSAVPLHTRDPTPRESWFHAGSRPQHRFPGSSVSDNPRVMTRARTLAGLLAALSLPVTAAAQGANAKPAPGSPTADQLPIYEIDPTLAADAAERLDPRRHPRAVRGRPGPPVGDPHAVEPHAAGDRRRRQAADRRLLRPRPASAGTGSRGQGAARVGRPRRGLHLVRPGARHLHRPQRLRVDGHEQRHARDEVHAGRQAPADHRRAGREQGQQRSRSPGRAGQLLRRAEDQRAVHRRRLHQQARRGV